MSLSLLVHTFTTPRPLNHTWQGARWKICRINHWGSRKKLSAFKTIIIFKPSATSFKALSSTQPQVPQAWIHSGLLEVLPTDLDWWETTSLPRKFQNHVTVEHGWFISLRLVLSRIIFKCIILTGAYVIKRNVNTMIPLNVCVSLPANSRVC